MKFLKYKGLVQNVRKCGLGVYSGEVQAYMQGLGFDPQCQGGEEG